MKDDFNFSDETQLYYEHICDIFGDALRLLWERGEHDQRENDLEKQWKAISPILKEAFSKARLYDLIHYSIPTERKDNG